MDRINTPLAALRRVREHSVVKQFTAANVGQSGAVQLAYQLITIDTNSHRAQSARLAAIHRSGPQDLEESEVVWL